MNNKDSNQENISKHVLYLFWKSLQQIRYLPFVIVIILIIVIFALIIPFTQDGRIIFYNDKELTLSIFTAILTGAIVFLLIELFSKIFLAGKKESSELFLKEIFIKHGLEDIFSARGINDEYEKRILKAKNRIWAIGMTNSNLKKYQLSNILSRISSNENIDVVISFWAHDSKFHIEYISQNEISIINQQLLIEDKKTIGQNVITGSCNEIKAEYQKIKNLKAGNLKLVEMTLPSNFTCFIIDDDVFFFPFLSTVESTSSPTILCNINRGIGKDIFEHFRNVLAKEEVTKIVYDSKSEK
jgi:hypothetical protein